MMPDDLDLMQLASAGQKLARLDDTDYLAVHVVLAWAADGTPTVYCAYHDWAATPIARLAAKDQEIAELAALAERNAAEVVRLATEVASLQGQLAARSDPAETPAQNQAGMFQAQAAYIGVESSAPPDPIVCEDCGKDGWKSPKALQMHRQRAHQGMVPIRTDLVPTQFVEELGWRCAEKGCGGAFTRSLSDPAHCTQHASVHTNGHHAHA